jgi:hypothetical protein
MEEDEEVPRMHSRRYIVYDSDTGAIVAAHDVLIPADEALPSRDDVREQLRGLLDDEVLERAETLEVDDDSPAVEHFVDRARRELRPLRRIEVRVDKPELDADGEDSAELQITVIDPDSGQVDETFSEPLVVTTSRGRLTERGGLVDAREGRVTLRLVSAPETVRAVRVVVEAEYGTALPGSVTLAFL